MSIVSYLVDTDLVIHHFKGNSAVTSRFDALQPHGLGLSIISLGELWEGIIHSHNPAGGEKKLVKFLTGIEVIPLNEAICKRFGDLRGSQRKIGKPIADFDLIATTALEHDLILLSNNRKHFANIPSLRLESI